MIDLDELLSLLPAHLASQRFYDGDEPPVRVELVDHDVWIEGDPGLVWLLVDAHTPGGAVARYQLFVGARWGITDHEFLHGKDHEILGAVDGTGGDVVVLYDAVIDSELVRALLQRVADVEVTGVRALNVEQSNTSIVHDESEITKLFRRVHDGPNPDVEAIEALQAAGFAHVPTQRTVFRRDGRDLAVTREYLSGAVDGWHLAMTSLRDLLGSEPEITPDIAGGDFGPEAERLGAITAELHLRMAEAFGTGEADLAQWVAGFRSQLDRVRDAVPAEVISARYDRVAALADVGPALRIHGDYHLAQTLRAASGWFVIDFEGEPARPVAERLRPSSALRDVAGMLRSFHYAAAVARRERGIEDDVDCAAHAAAWEERARERFLIAYLATPGIDELLPDDDSRELLLSAFELDKAVYEVAYELGFRPSWVSIPTTAITRLIGTTP